MYVTPPVSWIVFACLLVASCTRGELPPKRPVVPVVMIPSADEMTRDTEQPDDPSGQADADPHSSEDRWIAAPGANRNKDIQCVYYITGDAQGYSRRILSLAEAWRRGLDDSSIEMSCYMLRIVPPDLP